MLTFTFFSSIVKLFLISILFFNILIASENGTNNINTNTSYADSIDQDWHNSMMNNLKKDEYNIIYSESMEAYQSPNRANNIRFIYHKDGFTAKTRTDMIPLFDVNDKSIEEKDMEYERVDEWEIAFKLNNIETNLTNSSNYTNFNDSKLRVLGNKAFIEDENIRIDYTNNEEGMRQDFVVKKRLNDEGKLKLKISADTKLKMIVNSDVLKFINQNGIEKMKYSSLKCWDKNGKILSSYFEKNSDIGFRNNYSKDKNNSYNESSFNSFSIVVYDKDAVYPITIDPLSTSPDWTAESDQAEAYFGSSVSTAGDVNGDGFSDVIVGAYEYDNGETGEGRAFVYHGSASGLSTTANWTAESNQTDAKFGTSVATAGDVNGDGYSDIIVGAPKFDNEETDEGRVFVYHGSATGLSATANWTAESDQASANLGISASTASDVNGDGFSDVIVGALFYDNGETNEGSAFVYHGSAIGLSTTANWTAESNQADAWFGNSVSTAGDVNADGYSDVIVGAKAYDNGQLGEGRAYVYHGSETGLLLTANWTAESNQAGAQFGTSVSTAGDVNGDGNSDVIVGAPYFDNGITNEGRAFVYHGSPVGFFGNRPGGLSTTAAWTSESNQAGAEFAVSVSTAGDVNGDGYSDVTVGAPYFDDGEGNEGRAYIYQGSSDGLSITANWTAESNQGSAQLGISVSTAGDVNGDGFSDVIAGARFYNNGETNEGSAFVYHGSASSLSPFPNWFRQEFDMLFGSSVSTAGDVNGDGYSDVIVGAPNYSRAYVFYGSYIGLTQFVGWIAEGNEEFGSSVSTAGDVNGDGYSDVIIGATYSGSGTSVFVYHGSSSGLSTTANWTTGRNQFRTSVSTAGDVNGDGYSDVIVGSPYFDNGQSNEGRAIVYHGSAAGLSTTPSWIAESDQADAHFGSSVSTAGDVNGDGYSDVIVGGTLNDFAGQDNGMASVYYGSEFGLSTTANWTVESGDSRFGKSVSTAGDVNGDGFSDVIVGASKFSNGQNNEGSAYVYHGSALGLSLIADWTAESDQEGAWFGASVSIAGDVNGDGYSDVIVGAPYFDNGGTDQGRAYIYQGSELGLSTTEQWTAEGIDIKEVFGVSVSSMGDVNGDGYSDVIIGQDGELSGGFTNTVKGYYGNNVNGRVSRIQQYKPNSSIKIVTGGFSDQNGSVDLSVKSKSPFGRADGRMVYEYKANGIPFSSANGRVTNSVSNSGFGNTYEDLGVGAAAGGVGKELIESVTGLSPTNLYKWRARTEYSLVNNPFQKYSPWKYYSSYSAKLPDGFRPSIALPLNILASLTVYLEGSYNSSNNDMDINLTANIPLTSPYSEDPKTVTSIPVKAVDWVLVRLRDKNNEANILASRSAFLLEDGSIVELNGSGPVRFILPADNYFISVKHKNHLEVMSNNSITLTTN